MIHDPRTPYFPRPDASDYPQSKWGVGDQIKSLEDGVIGEVIDADYTAVKVRWEDGKHSQIGRMSNIAGRFERVC